AAALLLLWRRQAAVTATDRLVASAMQIAPSTYYYTPFQGGKQIGVASSAVDTSSHTMRMTDVLNARTVVYGDSQTVAGSSTDYLSRGFVLDSFALALGGDQGPLRLTGVPKGQERVFLPTPAPMALMLSGNAKVGRSGRYWVFNPLSQRVELTTLSIAAESLLSVVDSARYDVASRSWVPARTDTVRAWSVTTPAASVNAWVDAEGRVVTASEPGGMSMTRTAYEIASVNMRAAHSAKTPIPTQ
ncbi:MAG: hypothetical protein ACR2MQ_14550, partial [Gemmatimonadaceae bacterium]